MRKATTSTHVSKTQRTWRAYAFAGAVYSTLAVALTFPLVLHLSSVMPHDLGDPLLSTTILWWNAHVPWFTPRWWNGPAFFPAPGFLALSDPRLGESLIATPLQWLGCSPVTAYNLTLLATFPLSALAAHWLAFVVTGRHDASVICGLAYGFYPFRVAHLPHLELLAAFGMPAALAALHRYHGTRRRGWLIAFAIALVVQGLCSSYYLLFFSVFLGLWLLWFTRRDNARTLRGIVLAGGAAFVALVPLAVGYSRIHAHYGFTRQLTEIQRFSADATSILTTSPLVLLWGWTARWAKSEGELFPGATIAILAIVGVVLAYRRHRSAHDRLDRLSFWLLPIGAACAAIAVCGWVYAPWRISLGVARASSDAPFKPMTLALVAIAAWLGASSQIRGAYARRSVFAFYAIAAAVLFLCSLGPKPTFAGHQFMYQPPYAWLMRLGIFESIRVPARFAMPAMLALAMTGALAFDRVRLEPSARRTLAAAVMIGIVADGWIHGLPLPAVPEFWNASRADGFAAVLELPLGEPSGDFSAMFRTIDHRHPTVNGSSGFEPQNYAPLRTALDERDPAAFEGFPPKSRLLVVVDRRNDQRSELDRFLVSNPRVTRLPPDPRWAFYALEPPAAEAPPCGDDPLPIVSIADAHGAVDLGSLTDHDTHTWWTTPQPQQLGDRLAIDLGSTSHPCAVSVSVGESLTSYPRKLAVDTSVDGAAWTLVATRRTAGLTMKAALDDPRHVNIVIPITPTAARYVRLRIDETSATVPWLVTEVAVRGARAAE